MDLLCALIASVLLLSASSSASSPLRPHIVQIVADDLGYHDLGFLNGGATITPEIDALVADGVRLTDYYTFRVCAPSRAATMTGRYPHNVGFYDMTDDSHHCVHPSFKMLPQLLREQGYRTHATGKWDVGYVEQHCTPTFRGFESFLGYYTACTSDYWYHGAPGGNATESKCGGVDFHDSVTGKIAGAPMSGSRSVNGTYDADLFTARATDVIAAHDASESLYLYVAYHNVHDACTADRFALGLHAPKGTVERYPTTKLDTWKVQAAMTTELDYGVGNITAALRAKGMWNDTVLIFMSDNGGPLDHSANFPLRAGKGSEFEGGYRVMSFVASPLLPPAVRGTNFSGMVHSADWYATVFSGIARFPPPGDTGMVPADSINQWPALTGANATAPRAEVIHCVQSPTFNKSLGDVGVAAARFGKWKLIVGTSCTSNRVYQRWPTPGKVPVPFGKSGGVVESGTDHARAPLLPHVRSNGERGIAPDPTCAHGILSGNGQVCCAATCGRCGGPSCAKLPGGGAACCTGKIKDAKVSCTESPAPCVMSSPATKDVCLYDLENDLGETTNLAGDAAHADLLASLVAKLEARGAAAPDIAIAFADVGRKNKTADKATCAQEESTGYLEPIDWQHSIRSKPPTTAAGNDDS